METQETVAAEEESNTENMRPEPPEHIIKIFGENTPYRIAQSLMALLDATDDTEQFEETYLELKRGHFDPTEVKSLSETPELLKEKLLAYADTAKSLFSEKLTLNTVIPEGQDEAIYDNYFGGLGLNVVRAWAHANDIGIDLPMVEPTTMPMLFNNVLIMVEADIAAVRLHGPMDHGVGGMQLTMTATRPSSHGLTSGDFDSNNYSLASELYNICPVFLDTNPEFLYVILFFLKSFDAAAIKCRAGYGTTSDGCHVLNLFLNYNEEEEFVRLVQFTIGPNVTMSTRPEHQNQEEEA